MDIVEKLISLQTTEHHDVAGTAAEAIAEIERLRAERDAVVARLRVAGVRRQRK